MRWGCGRERHCPRPCPVFRLPLPHSIGQPRREGQAWDPPPITFGLPDSVLVTGTARDGYIWRCEGCHLGEKPPLLFRQQSPSHFGLITLMGLGVGTLGPPRCGHVLGEGTLGTAHCGRGFRCSWGQGRGEWKV